MNLIFHEDSQGLAFEWHDQVTDFDLDHADSVTIYKPVGLSTIEAIYLTRKGVEVKSEDRPYIAVSAAGETALEFGYLVDGYPDRLYRYEENEGQFQAVPTEWVVARSQDFLPSEPEGAPYPAISICWCKQDGKVPVAA